MQPTACSHTQQQWVPFKSLPLPCPAISHYFCTPVQMYLHHPAKNAILYTSTVRILRHLSIVYIVRISYIQLIQNSFVCSKPSHSHVTQSSDLWPRLAGSLSERASTVLFLPPSKFFQPLFSHFSLPSKQFSHFLFFWLVGNRRWGRWNKLLSCGQHTSSVWTKNFFFLIIFLEELRTFLNTLFHWETEYTTPFK